MVLVVSSSQHADGAYGCSIESAERTPQATSRVPTCTPATSSEQGDTHSPHSALHWSFRRPQRRTDRSQRVARRFRDLIEHSVCDSGTPPLPADDRLDSSITGLSPQPTQSSLIITSETSSREDPSQHLLCWPRRIAERSQREISSMSSSAQVNSSSPHEPYTSRMSMWYLGIQQFASAFPPCKPKKKPGEEGLPRQRVSPNTHTTASTSASPHRHTRIDSGKCSLEIDPSWDYVRGGWHLEVDANEFTTTNRSHDSSPHSPNEGSVGDVNLPPPHMLPHSFERVNVPLQSAALSYLPFQEVVRLSALCKSVKRTIEIFGVIQDSVCISGDWTSVKPSTLAKWGSSLQVRDSLQIAPNILPTPTSFTNTHLDLRSCLRLTCLKMRSAFELCCGNNPMGSVCHPTSLGTSYHDTQCNPSPSASILSPALTSEQRKWWEEVDKATSSLAVWLGAISTIDVSELKAVTLPVPPLPCDTSVEYVEFIASSYDHLLSRLLSVSSFSVSVKSINTPSSHLLGAILFKLLFEASLRYNLEVNRYRIVTDDDTSSDHYGADDTSSDVDEPPASSHLTDLTLRASRGPGDSSVGLGALLRAVEEVRGMGLKLPPIRLHLELESNPAIGGYVFIRPLEEWPYLGPLLTAHPRMSISADLIFIHVEEYLREGVPQSALHSHLRSVLDRVKQQPKLSVHMILPPVGSYHDDTVVHPLPPTVVTTLETLAIENYNPDNLSHREMFSETQLAPVLSRLVLRWSVAIISTRHPLASFSQSVFGLVCCFLPTRIGNLQISVSTLIDARFHRVMTDATELTRFLCMSQSPRLDIRFIQEQSLNGRIGRIVLPREELMVKLGDYNYDTNPLRLLHACESLSPKLERCSIVITGCPLGAIPYLKAFNAVARRCYTNTSPPPLQRLHLSVCNIHLGANEVREQRRMDKTATAERYWINPRRAAQRRTTPEGSPHSGSHLSHSPSASRGSQINNLVNLGESPSSRGSAPSVSEVSETTRRSRQPAPYIVSTDQVSESDEEDELSGIGEIYEDDDPRLRVPDFTVVRLLVRWAAQVVWGYQESNMACQLELNFMKTSGDVEVEPSIRTAPWFVCSVLNEVMGLNSNTPVVVANDIRKGPLSQVSSSTWLDADAAVPQVSDMSAVRSEPEATERERTDETTATTSTPHPSRSELRLRWTFSGQCRVLVRIDLGSPE
eukprot:GHVN01082566.1.p1 GENE.GHVN01082566.1~~GHVN01082566.1.p1  ORF type:complete len:1193 (+),score=251.19 GHVN01082566.1:666-4244(+)